MKNKVSLTLLEFYEEVKFRRMDWYSKIDRARSEDQFINGFARKFGSPEDVVVAIGDYSHAVSMSGQEPTKGKSIKKIFKKAQLQNLLD